MENLKSNLMKVVSNALVEIMSMYPNKTVNLDIKIG